MIYRLENGVFDLPSGPEQAVRFTRLLPVYEHDKLGKNDRWLKILHGVRDLFSFLGVLLWIVRVLADSCFEIRNGRPSSFPSSVLPSYTHNSPPLEFSPLVERFVHHRIVAECVYLFGSGGKISGEGNALLGPEVSRAHRGVGRWHREGKGLP